MAVSQIASDNVGGGKAAAEALAEQIGGSGKVFVNNTKPGISTTDQRAQGLRGGGHEARPRVHRAGVQPGPARQGGGDHQGHPGQEPGPQGHLRHEPVRRRGLRGRPARVRQHGRSRSSASTPVRSRSRTSRRACSRRSSPRSRPTSARRASSRRSPRSRASRPRPDDRHGIDDPHQGQPRRQPGRGLQVLAAEPRGWPRAPAHCAGARRPAGDYDRLTRGSRRCAQASNRARAGSAPSHRAWLGRDRPPARLRARCARSTDGFGWLDDDGVPDPGRPLQLWITARMTHVFALGDLLGDPGCGPLADHGLARASTRRLRGSRARRLVRRGRGRPPVDGAKDAYPHAFVLLAAASADDGRPRRRAGAARRRGRRRGGALLVGRRGRVRGGAGIAIGAGRRPTGAPTRTCTWSRRSSPPATRPGDAAVGRAGAADRRAPRRDGGEPATTGASSSTSTRGWRRCRTTTPTSPRHTFRPFGVTPGHAPRVVAAAAASCTRPSTPAPDWLLDGRARRCSTRAVADGWDAGGGFVYTTDLDGRPVVTERLHWVLTEAIGAAAALHAVTGDDDYEALLPGVLGRRRRALPRPRARQLAPRARRAAASRASAPGAASPTSTTRCRPRSCRGCRSRPSLAGALRDGSIV